MKISVDGGALNPRNSQRFGTAVFSENLVKALKIYDKKNQYSVYTFKNLKPKIFWMKGRVSLEEFKKKKDVFLALNQALPLYVSGKIISFCHGLSYYFYPKYYSKKDYVRLKKQLEEMVDRSDKIIVSSEKVKNELIVIHRNIERKIIVLPFGIPFDMLNENFKFQISNFKNKEKYFIFVGRDHPIKNINFIKKAFNELKKDEKYKDYILYILTKNVSRKNLKVLYQNATALLTSSYYESFNLPILEALSQGCPVVGLKSAVIPELKPYVNLANHFDEFVENMKIINTKPDAKSISRLYLKFNWKNYADNLVKLY